MCLEVTLAFFLTIGSVLHSCYHHDKSISAEWDYGASCEIRKAVFVFVFIHLFHKYLLGIYHKRGILLDIQELPRHLAELCPELILSHFQFLLIR